MPTLLSNEQYDSIMYTYQQARFSSDATRLRHHQTAYAAIPQLSEIDKCISSLAIKNIKRSSDSDKKALKSEIERLHNQKIQLLTKNGFAADYLESTYTCPICKDTGYDGAYQCNCLKKKIIDTIYSAPMWQNVFRTENFDTFDSDLFSDDASLADSDSGKTPRALALEGLNRAIDFSDHIKSGEEAYSMIIIGKPGTGKTFLCNCIAKDLIDAGKFVVYLTSLNLVEIFERVSFNKSMEKDFSPSVRDFNYSNLYDCDLLIIDDLGSEYTNSFTNPKVFDVLNTRLLEGLPTLISTNLGANELSEIYSERIISRIIGHYKWMRMAGEDIRIKKLIN